MVEKIYVTSEDKDMILALSADYTWVLFTVLLIVV